MSVAFSEDGFFREVFFLSVWVLVRDLRVSIEQVEHILVRLWIVLCRCREPICERVWIIEKSEQDEQILVRLLFQHCLTPKDFAFKDDIDGTKSFKNPCIDGLGFQQDPLGMQTAAIPLAHTSTREPAPPRQTTRSAAA